MVAHILLVGLVLAGADGQGGAAGAAADKLTLRDGSAVLGLVTATTPGPRGSVDFVVRRSWAEKLQPKHSREWERTSAAATRQAIADRRRRLETWRRERAAGADGDAGQNDRIVTWIDQELARLTAPGGPAPSFLLAVRLPRSEVHALDRKPASAERLLRLAWLCGCPSPSRPHWTS